MLLRPMFAGGFIYLLLRYALMIFLLSSLCVCLKSFIYTWHSVFGLFRKTCDCIFLLWVTLYFPFPFNRETHIISICKPVVEELPAAQGVENSMSCAIFPDFGVVWRHKRGGYKGPYQLKGCSCALPHQGYTAVSPQLFARSYHILLLYFKKYTIPNPSNPLVFFMIPSYCSSKITFDGERKTTYLSLTDPYLS